MGSSKLYEIIMLNSEKEKSQKKKKKKKKKIAPQLILLTRSPMKNKLSMAQKINQWMISINPQMGLL